MEESFTYREIKKYSGLVDVERAPDGLNYDDFVFEMERRIMSKVIATTLYEPENAIASLATYTIHHTSELKCKWHKIVFINFGNDFGVNDHARLMYVYDEIDYKKLMGVCSQFNVKESQGYTWIYRR